MTAPAPSAAPDPVSEPSSRRTRVPAAPLPQRPGADRALRAALTVVATLAVVLTVGGLGISSWLSANRWASFSDTPAAQALGRPSTLVLRADLGDITVVMSDDAPEVSLALTDPETGLAEGSVRARVTVSDGSRHADRSTVTVSQPRSRGSLLGAEPIRTLILTVPSDLAPALNLTVETDLGEIDVAGSGEVPWGTLSAHSDLGGVELRSLSATGAIEATSDLGDVTVGLLPDAAPTSITATSSTGDINVSVPGRTTYRVSASSGFGTVKADPSIHAAEAHALTARTDMGDVTVER